MTVASLVIPAPDSARPLRVALAGKPATDIELEAAEAFSHTTRRIAAPIARELGLDEKTLQDWGNVHSGDVGPHLRLLWITQLALAMRPLPADRKACFEALDFVEAHLGRVAFEMPTPAAAVTPAGRAFLAANAVVQLGEYLSLANGPSSAADRTRLAQERNDVVAALQSLWPEEIPA